MQALNENSTDEKAIVCKLIEREREGERENKEKPLV